MSDFIQLTPYINDSGVILINREKIIFFMRNRKDNETIVYLSINGQEPNMITVKEDVESILNLVYCIKLTVKSSDIPMYVNPSNIIDLRPKSKEQYNTVVRLLPYRNEANVFVVRESIVDISAMLDI